MKVFIARSRQRERSWLHPFTATIEGVAARTLGDGLMVSEYCGQVRVLRSSQDVGSRWGSTQQQCVTNPVGREAMENMLQSGYLSVLEAKTRDELQGQLVHFTRQLGFETFGAIAVVDHFLGEPEFITVDNTPAAYRATFSDRGKGKSDPVIQHCKHKSVPIIWDQSTYTKASHGDMWEIQARFGYRCGISLALHMPEGRHFVLGVDRDQALPNDPNELTRMVAAVQLFAVHAQEAAMRILVPSLSDSGKPALTPRELETLRWTMEGKTAWEVANVLGISERTAVLHANNAMHKLGCVNKHQAVLKALRLGLIR